MAESLGDAYVTIRPDTKGFEHEAGSKIGGALSGAAKVGVAAFAGLAVAAGAFGKRAVAEGTEAAQAMGQTTAAIKSTGGAANVTAAHVTELAGKLGDLAGVDDEAVQAGQNLLLTFTNIRNEVGKGNDIFDQASLQMVNLAARMGTDASGGAIQLGKALNDPVKGITALTRVGVSFTEEQKKQIGTMVAAGNTMGAQKIILAELNREFGGSAEAMGKNIAPGERLKLIFNNVAEEVGGSLIPVLNNLLPAVTPLITTLGPALGGVAATLAPLLGTVATVLGTALVPVMKVLIPALEVFIGALGKGLTNALTGVGPLLGVLAESFAAVITSLAPLLPALGAIIGALANALVPVLQLITPILVPMLPWILALVAALKVWTAAQVLLNIALTANPIGAVVVAIGALVAALAFAVVWIVKHWDSIVGAFKSALGWIKDHLSGFGQVLLVLLTGPLGAAALLIAHNWDRVKAAFSGVRDAIGWVIDKIRDAIRWFGQLKVPDWLKPGSPAPLETALWGIGRALRTIGTMGAPFNFAAPVLPRVAGAAGVAGAVGQGAVGGTTVLQVNLDGETLARVVYDQLLRMQRTQGPLFAATT